LPDKRFFPKRGNRNLHFLYPGFHPIRKAAPSPELLEQTKGTEPGISESPDYRPSSRFSARRRHPAIPFLPFHTKKKRPSRRKSPEYGKTRLSMSFFPFSLLPFSSPSFRQN
jgi:hypothetical protein